MKTRQVLFLMLATVGSAFGAPAERVKVELRAESLKAEGTKVIAKGTAVVVAGDTVISCEHLVMDNESGEIRCVGPAVIKAGQLTIMANDPKIATQPPKPPATPLRPHEIRDLPTGSGRL